MSRTDRSRVGVCADARLLAAYLIPAGQMTKAVWMVVAGWLLTACPVDRHEVGPIVHVQLTDSSLVKDTDTNPTLDLNGRTSYKIDMEVDVTDGTDDNGTMMNTFQSTAMMATATVPGVTIADSAFTPHDILDEIDYNRDAQLVIPASAMGSMLAIHAEAMDSRGLHSNVLDFTVALR